MFTLCIYAFVKYFFRYFLELNFYTKNPFSQQFRSKYVTDIINNKSVAITAEMSVRKKYR